MALKTLIVLMGCMSLARAGIAAVRAVDSEYDPHPQYSYGYDVQDSLTGDSKTHQETRDGDVVQGQYSLIDSDGTRRIVDYTADPINGFNAVVRKEALVAPVVAAPAQVVSAPAVVDGPTIVDARAGPVVAARTFAAPAVVAARTVAAPVLAAPATGVIAARTVAQPLFAPAARYAAGPVAYSAASPVAYSAGAPVAYSAAGPVAYSAAGPVAYTAAGPVAYSAAAGPVAYSTGPVAYSAAPYAYNGLASAPLAYSSPFARFASPVGYASPYTTLL